MRRPIIAGNWKMNLLRDPAADLARDLVVESLPDSVDVVVCPVATVLDVVRKEIADSSIALGAQNCFHAESGAFTGEQSPQMLRDAGCDWVIIGHSERRQIFGETDAMLAKKLRYARDCGINVMFCIGETLDQREAGDTFSVLEIQVRSGFESVDANLLDGVVIAYEPVWAIGTGVNATPEQAEQAHAHVRGLIESRYDATAAGAMRIQYGGSVKPDNAAELLGQPNVDGALVGGASLQAQSFATIVRCAAA